MVAVFVSSSPRVSEVMFIIKLLTQLRINRLLLKGRKKTKQKWLSFVSLNPLNVGVVL